MPPLDTTSSTTATSSAESDDVVFATTSDPKYPEHTHSHQSQVCIADDVPLVHVPPFRGAPFIPYPLNTHVAHHHGGVRTPTSVYQQRDPYAGYNPGPGSMGGKTPPSSGSRRSPSSKSLKQKAIKYKSLSQFPKLCQYQRSLMECYVCSQTVQILPHRKRVPKRRRV